MRDIKFSLTYGMKVSNPKWKILSIYINVDLKKEIIYVPNSVHETNSVEYLRA